MHNKGATRHGVVPTIVGQEVGLDKAQPLNRSNPRDGSSGGVSLSAGANCPNHLIALFKEYGITVLSDVTSDACKQNTCGPSEASLISRASPLASILGLYIDSDTGWCAAARRG